MSDFEKWSDWAMQANRILFSLAYLDNRRGLRPLGDLLPRLLDTKWEFVKLAQQVEREGRPWTPEEFRDLCFDGFEKILGTADQTDSHERRVPRDASGDQPLPSSEAA